MPEQRKWNTIPEIVQAAKATIPPPLWYFSGSGPESEITVRRNRAAFDHLGFMPRVMMGDMTKRTTATTFLGHRISSPVMLAPLGYIGSFHPDGAAATARVAAQAGTASFVATNSTPGLEEVRAAADAPIVFQLYMWGSPEWQERMIRRVEKAGYDALCITVDSAAAGRRDRYLPAGFENNRQAGTEHPNLESMGTGPGAEPARGKEREQYAAGSRGKSSTASEASPSCLSS